MTQDFQRIDRYAQLLMPHYNDLQLCRDYALQLLIAATEICKNIDEQQAIITAWINEHVTTYKPIPYIIGSVNFGNLSLLVAPPVLIPRSETLFWLTSLQQQLSSLANRSLDILDLCTGNGCIALTLAQALPQARIVASDICPHAVALTQKNAQRIAASHVTVIESDLFAAINQAERFDLIVANPPYIKPSEFQFMDQCAQRWEDRRAIVSATDNGLALTQAIIAQASSYLKKESMLDKYGINRLWFELGYDQGTAASAQLKYHGYKNIQIIRDADGWDRAINATL